MANPAVKRALKIAGVERHPLNRRVWQWLKDNGKHTAVQVGLAMNEAPNNVSAQLTNLYDRGMVIKSKELDKSKGKNGHLVAYYMADPKLRSFELLPITKEGRERIKQRLEKKEHANDPVPPKEPFVVAGTAHLVSPAPAVEPPKPDYKKLVLENMNVIQAHELFLVLKDMFEKHKFPA